MAPKEKEKQSYIVSQEYANTLVKYANDVDFDNLCLKDIQTKELTKIANLVGFARAIHAQPVKK